MWVDAPGRSGGHMGTTAADARTAAQDEGDGQGSPWAWKLRVVALVVAFAVVAWARSRQVDVPFKDPHGKLFRAKLPDTAELLAGALVVDVLVRWLRHRSQGATLRSTARARWTPYRIAMIL